jgi:putative copper resistance protein D
MFMLGGLMGNGWGDVFAPQVWFSVMGRGLAASGCGK